jgi:hypothetical protein
MSVPYTWKCIFCILDTLHAWGDPMWWMWWIKMEMNELEWFYMGGVESHDCTCGWIVHVHCCETVVSVAADFEILCSLLYSSPGRNARAARQGGSVHMTGGGLNYRFSQSWNCCWTLLWTPWSGGMMDTSFGGSVGVWSDKQVDILRWDEKIGSEKWFGLWERVKKHIAYMCRVRPSWEEGLLFMIVCLAHASITRQVGVLDGLFRAHRMRPYIAIVKEKSTLKVLYMKNTFPLESCYAMLRSSPR